MLYKALHLLLKPILRIWFRKVLCVGWEHIPAKGPVLLLANHSNTVLDPVALALAMKRPLHFLARGDVFNSAFKRYFLKALHVAPIFRIRDGLDRVKQNDEAFAMAESVLNSGGVLLVFIEGNSETEYRLRSLKKGAARIYLQSSVRDRIKVIPMGINYSRHQDPHSILSFECGSSLPVQLLDGLEPAKAVLQFNLMAEEALQSLVWQAESKTSHAAFIKGMFWGDVLHLQAFPEWARRVKLGLRENVIPPWPEASLEKLFHKTGFIMQGLSPLYAFFLPVYWLLKLPKLYIFRYIDRTIKVWKFRAGVKFVLSAVALLLVLPIAMLIGVWLLPNYWKWLPIYFYVGLINYRHCHVLHHRWILMLTGKWKWWKDFHKKATRDMQVAFDKH